MFPLPAPPITPSTFNLNFTSCVTTFHFFPHTFIFFGQCPYSWSVDGKCQVGLCGIQGGTMTCFAVCAWTEERMLGAQLPRDFERRHGQPVIVMSLCYLCSDMGTQELKEKSVLYAILPSQSTHLYCNFNCVVGELVLIKQSYLKLCVSGSCKVRSACSSPVSHSLSPEWLGRYTKPSGCPMAPN